MGQKLPSIFRTTKHKRFFYEPWYYDAVKEEIEQRESLIKRELDPEDEAASNFRSGSGIRGSFRKTKAQTGDSTFLLRMIIFTMLVGGALSVWYFGKNSVYFLLLILPVYFILRKRKIV